MIWGTIVAQIEKRRQGLSVSGRLKTTGMLNEKDKSKEKDNCIYTTETGKEVICEK